MSTSSLIEGKESTWPSWLKDYVEEEETLPIDQNLHQVFLAVCFGCRVGDYDTVEKLLSNTVVDINEVDEWNNSPLMLASLCGHYEIVKLLLSRGAICNRDLHMGSRVIYGALNDKIRLLLISYDISKAVDDTQEFVGHVASFINSSIILKDIGLECEDVFITHRFLMASRSEYFAQKLETVNDQMTLKIDSNPKVVTLIINYLYFQQSLDFSESLQDEIELFAKRYELHDLATCISRLRETTNYVETYKVKAQFSKLFITNAMKLFEVFLNEKIIQKRIQVKLDLEADIELEDIRVENYLDKETKTRLCNSGAYPDAIIASIDIGTESVFYYPVNKMMLTRSEYFDTMFKSEIYQSSNPILTVKLEGRAGIELFDRTKGGEGVPVLQLSSDTTNTQVTEYILSYLYLDSVPELKLELTPELLFAADELFLERLKTICATKIISKVPFKKWGEMKKGVGYNVFDLLRISWKVNCEKLEQHITKMIAYNLEEIYVKEKHELISLIGESASKIKERQETDTIELIDEIRYYLADRDAKKRGSRDESDVTLSDEIQDILDSMLEELNLDA